MSRAHRLSVAALVAVLPLAGASLVTATAPIDDQLMATLSAAGTEMAADIDWTQRPDYSVQATIDPDSGAVVGRMTATLPVGAAIDRVHLRWLPGIVDPDADIGTIVVDSVEIKPEVDESIVSVTLPSGHGERVDVAVDFAFSAPLLTETTASDDEFDWPYSWLIYRTEDAVVLGHWFPIWIPEGLSAESELRGRADIGNFPAGTIRAELAVPEGDALVSGGVRLGEVTTGRRVVYTEGAVGLRDLAVVVLRDAEQVHRTVGDVDVAVTASRGTPDIDDVADEAVASVATLSEAFGGYPWDQLDVVAAPFTPGMEWPGMVWIGTFMFGLPGAEDLPPNPSDDSLFYGTVRTFTVAHEVGHMWWHALVGNDSLLVPVVDEPLAQHSGCLVLRVLAPAEADRACDVNTGDQFIYSDVADGPADQGLDDFVSGSQYAALVYGKAPMFYRALEDTYGRDQTTAALAVVVERYAFEQIIPDQLRATLGEALGDPRGVDALWQRWIEEAHGREDLVE